MPDSRHAATRQDERSEHFIARLYRSGLSVAPESYRAWALRELATLIPHDGALWGSGTAPGYTFHSVTVVGLPPEFPAALEATRSQNPLLPRILSKPDTPMTMDEVTSDSVFFKSELYRRSFAPFGIARILSSGHADPRSGLLSLLTLYRKDRKQPFTSDEKQLQRRLIIHLFQAASHAYFLHLSRSQALRAPGSGAAVVDRRGFFHEAQPRFLDLLEQHFPGHSRGALPFALPVTGTQQRLGTLCLHAEPLGDLIRLQLWPAGPLDRLTPREREIVDTVTQGLSFKQAARKIGVAPSTVANHLYRIYRKLGVASRTELAGLVHPSIL